MMEKRMRVSSRIISLCLILAMLLALVPAFPIVADAATTYNVKIYFKDTDGWGSAAGYVWNGAGTNLLGDWPGKNLSYDSNTNCYVLECAYTANTNTAFNFIFNNNNQGKQTANLKLSNTQLASCQTWWVNGPSASPAKVSMPVNNNGKVTFTYTNSSASSVKLAGTMNDWSGVTMTKSGSTFTYTCQLAPGSYQYKFVVDGNWIADPANPATTGNDGNSVYVLPGLQAGTINVVKGVATELPGVMGYTDAFGSATQKAVTYTVPSAYSAYATISNNQLTVKSTYTGTTMTLNATTTSGETATVTVKLVSSAADIPTVKVHFVNTLGWQGVCYYAWSNATSSTFNAGTWPGKVAQRDGTNIHTVELTHTPASGETLGILFHNNKGAQTADVTITNAQLTSGAELWVIPKTTAGEDGKHACTVATSASKAVYSPVVNGKQVTFKYSGSATSVAVAGSFNNWSSTANKMTKGTDGVWSTTLTLEPGVHEYKLIVNGTWTLDPLNGIVGGYDGNNIVEVPGEEKVEDGKIKVVLHFYRASGSYTGWDVWFWGNGAEGAATFSDDPVNKGKIATFYIDGESNSNLGYVVRKTDWSDKEFYDRFIDLSDVVGGTVHFYLNAGSETGSRVLGADAVNGGKVTDAALDYSTGKLYPSLSMPISGSVADAFDIVDTTGKDTDIAITSVELVDGKYVLTLNKKLGTNGLSNYKVTCNGTGGPVWVDTHALFYNGDFNRDYNYTGDDLGATWSKTSTTFKVWAPTAKHVQVLRYRGGNYGGNDWIETVDMTLGAKGVWTATVSGDLHGTYYNYLVHFENYTVEATDPYAKSTGANGDRGMVLNMAATNPAGWENDVSPYQNMSVTDAIIYEMHIREFTIDASSGVKNKGKYLGLTETGTNYNGYATGLAHLKELGITHVQLMPAYDYNSVDEYHLTDWQQYAWGYDPKNYNVPEGSYSTDPFNGAVRVNEFKQMVQSLHRNGINVVMDVVYNHTFDGGNFCYNKIVPNYFHRFYGEGNWSNGSGVGNDMATERVMTRNYIVDNIMNWIEEYHIDGFRFDLAGLIDTQTINEIVNTVRAKYPNVIFYGEGWGVGDTAVEYGYDLATKGNAWQVPGFGFFNDNFRNDIAGDNGNSWGFATGDSGKADAIASYFRASNGWSLNPTQTINYVSCHDNYSLMDKIIKSKDGTAWYDMVKMNNLSAAIYMLAQGTPFIYSGEELLREKKDANGNRYDNAYGTDDYINKIRWSDLQDKTYAQMTDDYYAGLVAFRKNHAALRCPNGGDAWNYTNYYKINDHLIMFYVDGYPNWECSDGIVIIYNASSSTQWVNLSDYGIPTGTWNACIHGDKAGTDALWSMSVTGNSGSVGVDALSTTVLVKGDLIHEDSVYNQNLSLVSCKHTAHDTNGNCTTCGAAVGHNYKSVVTKPTCTTSGYTTYTCSGCGSTYKSNAVAALGHKYENGTCTVPGVCANCGGTEAKAPGHKYESVVTAPTCTTDGYTTYTCSVCGDSYTDNKVTALGHSYDKGVVTKPTCTEGGYTTYTCSVCGYSYDGDRVAAEGHSWKDATCTEAKYCSVCGETEGESLGHTPGEPKENVIIVPDCVDEGMKEIVIDCSVCGENISTETVEIPVVPHDWKGVVTKPTCTEGGYTTYTCSVCGDSYVGDQTESAGHKYEAVVTKPTCTEGGYTTHTCSACGDSYVDSKTSSIGHNYQNGTCVNCGDGCAHEYSSVTTEPDCANPGKTVYTCSVCGYSYEESISALGHKYQSVVTTPTCTEGGYTTYTCSVCGDSYVGDQTESAGHKYEGVVTAPTCTEGGYTTYTCSVCGDSYVGDQTESAGHKYEAVTTEPDCANPGKTVYTCSACGDSYEESIDALGHKYEAVVTDPTCTEGGYTTHTCSVCGDSYVDSKVDSLGHSYVDGTCENCGEAKPVKAPTLLPGSGGLAFKDEIYYNVYFMINNPDKVEIVETGVISWTSPIDGTIDTAEHVSSGSEPYATYFKARSNPISAKNMGEELYMKVYARLADGTYVYSQLINYSAKTYAMNMINKDGNGDDVKALCVALLNYGAAAQQYFGYKTDELMNADISEEAQALVSAYSDSMIPELVQPGDQAAGLAANDGFVGIAPSVNFGGALGINYTALPKKAVDGDVKLYIWTEAELAAGEDLTLDNAVEVITMTAASSGVWTGRYSGISARKAGATVYACAVYTSGDVEYRTGVVSYSVAAYCKSYANKDGDKFQNMASLAAVYTYYANACLGN